MALAKDQSEGVPRMNDPSANVIIRRIQSGDIEGFHHCLDAVARERRYLAFLEAPPLDQVRSFVESNLADNVAQAVAVVGGAIVGWCDICPLPHVGMQHVGNLGMGLLPEHRRRGIGTALVHETIEQARRFGLTRVQLEVFASNVGAIRLYETTGFEREGFKRRGRIVDDIADDLVCMARLLQ